MRIWQYSSSGRIYGINGNVDLDISYQDYPSVITAGGFNGYGEGSKPAQITSAPSPAPSQPGSSGFSVGDQVKVIHPVTYDGRRFTVWYDTYTVMEITGDRVVIGVNGTVTAAVKRSSVQKV